MHQGSGYKILCVEDSAGDRRLIAEVFSLQKLKCQLIFRNDGEAGIEYLQKLAAEDPAQLPDLIGNAAFVTGVWRIKGIPFSKSLTRLS